MKTVLSREYKIKKTIADNLSKLTNTNLRYINISDGEFTRINNAINFYNNLIDINYSQLDNIIPNSGGNSGIINSTIESILSQIQLDITNLKDNGPIDVEENGLFFIDEDGYIGAKITNSGFFAINSNQSNSGSSSSISGDLTIIDY